MSKISLKDKVRDLELAKSSTEALGTIVSLPTALEDQTAAHPCFQRFSTLQPRLFTIYILCWCQATLDILLDRFLTFPSLHTSSHPPPEDSIVQGTQERAYIIQTIA